MKVTNIIDDEPEQFLVGTNFTWPDEVEDTEVESMVKLIAERFHFRKEMFVGGLTIQGLAHMKLERQREKDAKEKHNKDNAADSADGDSSDHNSTAPIASIVAAQLKHHIGGLESRLMIERASQKKSIRGND